MLNDLLALVRRYDMIQPGDRIIAAVSGGADSVALLYALYLLKEKLGIRLEVAHFNHGLRGGESDRDEAFVRSLCDRLDIPCHVGSGIVKPGKKGLEAAAREARYAYFETLGGKIATAHTADDNAETVLMRLVRGTGLKGLGGIAPVRGDLIRPMLNVTRQQVLDFLKDNCLTYVEDSSNGGDDFLRNRLRHHVVPLLRLENPRLAENLSAMAMKLRQDEALLDRLACGDEDPSVACLRSMDPALRSRALGRFLEKNGIREPEAEHIRLTEKLVFSDKPSARASLPGGITVTRDYDRLTVLRQEPALEPVVLPASGTLELPDLGLRVICEPWNGEENHPDCFAVSTSGTVVLRSRLSGDTIRLSGGTKSLKKLFVDRKIPASRRLQVPVVADDRGVLGIFGFGGNLDRLGPGLRIRFEEIENNQEA